jgi:hypothetical protein
VYELSIERSEDLSSRIRMLRPGIVSRSVAASESPWLIEEVLGFPENLGAASSTTGPFCVVNYD